MARNAPEPDVEQAKMILDAMAEKISALPEAERLGLETDFRRLRLTLQDILKRDLENHKKASIALEQSRIEALSEASRLNAVLEALPVGVCLVDREGGILQNNHGYEEVWGGAHPLTTSVDDYVEYLAWWSETGQPVKPEEWASALAVRENRTVTGQMLTIQRFDGRRAHVINSAAPIRDAEGHAVGCAVVIVDITEQTNTEQALHESENRLRIALENSPVNIFTQDCDLRFTWVFRPAYGFTQEDFVGKRDDELPFVQNTAEILAAKKQVIETGRGVRREFLVRVHGEERYFLVTLEPLREEKGQIVGLRGSSIDITELRSLQARQIEYSTQIEVHHRLMEQREKDRQAFARAIHDGPIQSLSSVLFNLQFAKETVSEPQLHLEMEQIAQKVKQSIQELRQMTFEMRPPSIIRFGLARTIQFHAEEIQEKNPNFQIILHLADDASRLPEMTSLTLFQIYQEAIANVIRHAEATTAWVRFEIQNDQLILEVRDNGKGLPENATVHNLAENGRFGLAGIMERIQAIAGKLSVVSTPGKGTILRVTAPAPKKDSL